MKKLLPLCASLALIAGPAMAGFHAYQISSPDEHVKLDGKLDDAVWKKAAVHDTFWQTQPVDKVAAPMRTEVRVAYDKRYMYVGLTAFDADPSQIRGPFARRDKASPDQDLLGLYIDTSGAHKSARFIYVNPRGALTDGIYTDTNGEDASPDFEVDVATARFEGGWTAEIRIPFSSLPYNAAQVEPWQLLVFRNLTREQRYRLYSGQVTRATSCNLCFSEPIEGMKDLPTGLNWNATPQLVLGRSREDVAGQPRRNSSNHALSLDVKVRPDSATTIDATINPDFSQIELDAPQLSGNTRFGLYVQEKRPFFLEGSDVLQTPFRAISTRTISDPAWGARYTRRDAAMDMTILTNHDAGGGLVQLPNAYGTDFAPQNFSSQATDARANFRFGKLAVGGVFTDRTLDGARGYNRVVGPDFVWQRSEDERMRGQLLLSATTAVPGADGNLIKGARSSGHAAMMDWSSEHETWGLWSGFEDVSDGFRADNGFFSEVGYTDFSGEVTKKTGKGSFWNEFNFYFHVDHKIDREGKLIAEDTYPGMWMAGPYDSQINVRMKVNDRLRVQRDGEVFTLRQIYTALNISPGKTVARVSAELELGDEVDVASSRLGRGGYASLYARLRPFDRLELEPTYSVSWINGRQGVESGQRLYTEQALQLNGIYHFGPRDTLRMILQKARTTRNPALYAFPVAAKSSSGTSSFVYGHTAGLGTTAYAGLTLSNGDTPGFSPKRRENELFVKLSWQL